MGEPDRSILPGQQPSQPQRNHLTASMKLNGNSNVEVSGEPLSSIGCPKEEEHIWKKRNKTLDWQSWLSLWDPEVATAGALLDKLVQSPGERAGVQTYTWCRGTPLVTEMLKNRPFRLLWASPVNGRLSVSRSGVGLEIQISDKLTREAYAGPQTPI